MFEQLTAIIKKDPKNWEHFQNAFTEIEIPAREVVLNDGEIPSKIFFIKKGCLRQWFNKEGKDITFQFFFEGQGVASLDSFVNNTPSIFSIESIEASVLYTINKKDFDEILAILPELQDLFQKLIFRRFGNYTQLFLSRIKDSPQERYNDLLENYPEIITRVPQHYIASYLGITSVSLSRIRNRR
ncbi:Crp/Fnr family transcriptional regulator [Flammeovirga kamogawensis]|uniref:Crp/Fnr family transcriptional regulator n=1 Tax=Flammeovirga kamogawensis TaxID=373891 RepID=A0ABX8GYB6_9BACT|nr:Crp/Fnr family transcriptional regulator [Flammeovirga kamogawensis]MBB6459038.1 CRP-like cAMP-binding protein [Flammeovirga kamogawensis]QWG08608.1 Crp/Fnr family transcriptional regulator [Flammeovirga kamogawensis]TRX66901.1 Crp/Fnr family transcriptional regulator [Flammeovirga kamogawensis]